MKVSEIKIILHSRSRTVFFEGFFFSGGLSLEAIHQSSGSSFSQLLSKDYQEKLTTLLEPLYSDSITVTETEVKV